MPTLNDVARLASVSNATVSHVINKSRKVNPETIAKVEWAIRELDYRPNEQARSLKTGLSRQIGVLNYHSVDAYFSEVLCSLESAAHDADYHVMLRHTEREGENQGAAIEAWLNRKIDGLIVNSPYLTEGFYDLIHKLSCPVVFLHFNDPTYEVDTICNDDWAAGYEATRHLIELGHTRIGCIAGCAFEYHSAWQRRIGYQKALAEAGLAPREEYFDCTFYAMEEGYQLFKKMRNLPEPPTAFITYSDQLAIGVIRAAADMGLTVPGDISVVGFDDIELASFVTPRLTTIYQDKALIGEIAVKLILKRLEDPARPLERIVLPARLVIRESTGPVREI